MVVTGASGGIGLETARALAAHGATVVMASRDETKNEAGRVAILDAHPDADLELATLDLGDLATVRTAAATILERHDRIHVLVNNAGVMATPEGRTVDGFETQFGVDHLGHFALSLLLAPALMAGAPSRVVTVSSAGHGMGDVDFDDPHFERRPYDKFEAYGQAKTANILFSVGFDRLFGPRGVRAFAVHPGGIRTELGRYFTAEDAARLQAQIASSAGADGGAFRWKSVPAGAATSVWAATAPELDGHGGIYLEDCGFSHPRSEGAGQGSGYVPSAVDPDRAERLWQLSMDLVGDAITG
jgi:NAD(P)-dependent dehydrogenase (short-subunit alcohol dehydrogenase family)